MQTQLLAAVNKITQLKEQQKEIEKKRTASETGFNTELAQADSALAAAQAAEEQRIQKIRDQLADLDRRYNEGVDAYTQQLNDWQQEDDDNAYYNQNWRDKLENLKSEESRVGAILQNLREGVSNNRDAHQNTTLAATGGGAGLIVLLSALNKLRKRKKKEISPEEYLNYLEEEGMA